MSEHAERDLHGKALAATALAALGVVFGDIGTSPLYALQDSFHGPHGVPPTPENVLGVLSLFFWSLLFVVSFKYVFVIMRADNRGEGGILALTALSGRRSKDACGPIPLVLGLGLFGAALLYGDGVITPAISVLSAIEGLKVATPVFDPYVVPITLVLLAGLFAIQPLGTARVGSFFGPVLTVWFLVIAALGAAQIAANPSCLRALDPRHGARFFAAHGFHGLPILGSVILCLTGAEALYADMGHFGKKPIRYAWFTLALPALFVNYLGQGALLLHAPSAAAQPFFRMAPLWSIYPLVVLATLATIVASQALITAVFSMTQQAAQLGFCPRFKVVHTSAGERGQIYLPAANWTLMIGCMALVLMFRSSGRLAAAFGLAVAGTMAITTVLFGVVARERLRWPLPLTVGLTGLFLFVDLAFFGANLVKFMDGGWLPLAIGGVVMLLMTTWYRGRALLTRYAMADPVTIPAFLGSLEEHPVNRIRGTGVFLSRTATGVPLSLLQNVRHNQVLHERVVLLNIQTEEVPFVTAAERLTVTPHPQGIFLVEARYGFMEQPNVPTLLRPLGLLSSPETTTYYMGRETIISSERPGMARWREALFGVLLKNASPVSSAFGLPPDQVVEMGTQVEI